MDISDGEKAVCVFSEYLLTVHVSVKRFIVSMHVPDSFRGYKWYLQRC